MNKTLCAGLALIATVVGLGYIYVSDQPEAPVAPSTPSKKIMPSTRIGSIDLERLIEAQFDSVRFAHLDEREHFLRIELNNAMRPITIEEPTVDSKPFDDSVWQKNAQTIISEAAEIERRKKQAAEDYRKTTEAEYLKRRDEIDGQFLNETFNIRMKLQNAKVMRLTEEEVAGLEKRLSEIQRERGEIQRGLEEQWIQEIADHAEASIKDDVEKLRAQAQESMERVKAQAREEQEAAQARNRAVMERSQAVMERRQLVQTLTHELEDVINERQALEDQVLREIEDETVRLAVVHNLSLVLLRRDLEERDKFYPFDFETEYNFDLNRPRGSGAVVFPTAGSIDLTDELIRELKRRGAQDR
mgnify:CR=1 FL=1